MNIRPFILDCVTMIINFPCYNIRFIVPFAVVWSWIKMIHVNITYMQIYQCSSKLFKTASIHKKLL